MTKKKSDKESAVIIATEEKKVKLGKDGACAVVSEEDESDEEDETKEDESEESETVETESEDESEDESEEETISKMKKPTIKESTDHIIGIVSTGKLHLLEDGIIGVVKSKIREKIDEQKDQIKAKLIFKGE